VEAPRRLVQGFFSDSLTPELARQLRPADIVDVDSDIYISAYQALDWVFTHKLARRGTLIVYDDFMDYTCAPKLNAADFRGVDFKAAVRMMNIGTYGGGRNTSFGKLYAAKGAAIRAGRFPGIFEGGEPKAHREMAEKHGVRFQCVAGACAFPSTYAGCDPHRAFGAIFLVVGFDRSRASHGVSMTEKERSIWRQQNQACKFVSQSRFTLTDDIRDGETGRELIAATIADRKPRGKGRGKGRAWRKPADIGQTVLRLLLLLLLLLAAALPLLLLLLVVA